MSTAEYELAYLEDGCRFWQHCLTCPYPRCLFEEPGGPIRALARHRNEEIRTRYAAGESARQLAIAFGLNRRSINHILEGDRGHQAREGMESEPGSCAPAQRLAPAHLRRP